MIELEDPTTFKRFWSLPGGMIEQGESPESCAVRETFEETGYAIHLTSEGLKTNYLFRWNKHHYACECHWFLGALNEDHEPAVVTDADYLLGTQWIPLPRVAAHQFGIIASIQCTHSPRGEKGPTFGYSRKHEADHGR